MIGLGSVVRAGRVLAVATVSALPLSNPVTAQPVLETEANCSTGACTPTAKVPPEGTVIRCLVIPQVPETAFLIRCVDLFMGTVSADPRVNGFTGSLVCTRMMEVSCPDVIQATVKDHPEPLSVQAKLDCTVRGHYMTYNLTFECAQ